MKLGRLNQILPGTVRGIAAQAWWRGPASPLEHCAGILPHPPSPSGERIRRLGGLPPSRSWRGGSALESAQPPHPATLAAKAASCATSPRRGEGKVAKLPSKLGFIRNRAIFGGADSGTLSYCDDAKEVAMPDNRKTNSLTDEDRAAAEELALLLGVSSSELIEEFEESNARARGRTGGLAGAGQRGRASNERIARPHVRYN